MTAKSIYYFGYGSLVNRDTRPINEEAMDAHLHGWRRAWLHRVGGVQRPRVNCTSLTIEPVESVTSSDQAGIDGVLVRMDTADLPALDARESGYERLSLSADCFDLPGAIDADEIMVYRSLPDNRQLAEAGFPILKSYIDCVMAGYLHRFGDTGLRQMVKSTRGWERTILNDRATPFYPRHVVLEPQHQRYFDHILSVHTE
jgi:hypothetical protein